MQAVSRPIGTVFRPYVMNIHGFLRQVQSRNAHHGGAVGRRLQRWYYRCTPRPHLITWVFLMHIVCGVFPPTYRETNKYFFLRFIFLGFFRFMSYTVIGVFVVSPPEMYENNER